MPVVINEFEVLSEPTPAPANQSATADANGAATPPELQPQLVAQALRNLEQQALRTWAH